MKGKPAIAVARKNPSVEGRADFLILVVAAILMPLLAAAHGRGLALQTTVDLYTVDVHYPFPFRAKVPIWLNFFLSSAQNHDHQVYFSDLDAAVFKDREMILRTNINRKQGIGSGAVITFPEPGDYRVQLIFNSERDQIVEAYFDIYVPAEHFYAQIFGLPIFQLVLGAFFGAFGVFLFRKISDLLRIR